MSRSVPTGFKVLSVLLYAACFAAHAADGTPLRFDIPSQELAAALKQFAVQSDLEILFAPDDAAAKHSGVLKGEFERNRALQLLLEGSGLTYRITPQGSIVVEPVKSSAEVAPVENLRLVRGLERDNGTEPEKSNSETATGASDPGAQEVLVTGSRLRRTNVDGPAPVTVFDRERIDELGVTQLADILNYLPQQTFSNNEAFNAGGARYIRLRGLGLGTTLVLINGRRTVTSALSGASNVFDLNTVPLAAVERVEVLADSASAVYGADAVGGVLNIILKKHVDAPVVDLHYGSSGAGGGDERQATLTFGHSGERLHALAVVDRFERDFLLGENLDRFANQDYRRFGGTDFRVMTTNPANICALSGNLPGLTTPCAVVPSGSTGIGLTQASFLPTAGQTNLQSLGQYTTMVPQTRRSSAAVSAQLDLTSTLELFAELMYADRKDLSQSAPLGLTNVNVPATNAFNPFGVAVRATYLATGTGPTRISAEAESFRTVAGLRGAWRSWDWEISALDIGEDGVAMTPQFALDTTFVTAALNSNVAAQALNVFQDGPGGSDNLLASFIRPPRVNNFSSDALQGSGFIRGPLWTLPAGDLQLVVGAEARREDVHIESVPALIMSADRDTSSAFAELRVPLIEGRLRRAFVNRLAVTLAGRYDDYSDFGGTFNPQYGVEWTPFSQFLLRASYGTSFRAPSLFEVYQPQRILSGQAQDPARNNLPSTFTQLFGGSLNVGPEESTSWTAGFVWTPRGAEVLRLSMSYWTIEQEQRILGAPSNTAVLVNENLYPERIVRAPRTASDIALGIPGALTSVDTTTINGGRLSTSGIDFQISDVWQTSRGQFTPSLSATWIDRFRTADFPIAPIIDRLGIANSQGTIVRWRSSATLAWNLNGVGVSSSARYVPAYDDALSNTANGRTVEAQLLVDLQGSLNVGERFGAASPWLEGVAIRAGVSNLFDKEPPFAINGASSGYDSSQADTRQRFFYVTLSKTF